MNFKELESKIAIDNSNMKLGKIVRIDNMFDNVIKKYKPFVMILVKKRFMKDIIIPLAKDKIIKADGKYIRFDIIKDEFDNKVKTARAIQAEQEIYTGTLPKQPGQRLGYYDPTGLVPKGKERKK